MTISVFADKCNGIDQCPESGVCIKVCALNAISDSENMPIIDDENCFDCGLCVLNCPNEALSK